MLFEIIHGPRVMGVVRPKHKTESFFGSAAAIRDGRTAKNASTSFLHSLYSRHLCKNKEPKKKTLPQRYAQPLHGQLTVKYTLFIS